MVSHTQPQVAIVGSGGRIPGSAFIGSSSLMERVGGNTGNLVFQYAVSSLLRQEHLILGFDEAAEPWQIPTSVRLIVFPAANLVRPGLDLTSLVDRLERTQLPLLMVGLGAEAVSREFGPGALHPSIHRLVGLIRERSRAVSVRGDRTAEVLTSMRVENILVTGCPSNFINPLPDFPARLHEKLGDPLGSLMVHGGEPWPKAAAQVALEKRLAEWAFSGPATYVQQSVPLLQHLLRGDSLNQDSMRSPQPALMKSLRRALLPEKSDEEMNKFVRSKWRSYFNVEQWLEDSRRFDFSVGGRVHGNMVAFQAGVPSLFITVDGRSSELVETMNLPAVEVATFLAAGTTPERALALARFSPERYRQRRSVLWRRMKEAFAASGSAVSHPSLDS